MARSANQMGLGIHVSAPANGTIVGREFNVNGSITPFGGTRVDWKVSIIAPGVAWWRNGSGMSILAQVAQPNASRPNAAPLPVAIQPGQSFQIEVTASGLNSYGEWIDGIETRTVTLVNHRPHVTISPYQRTLVALSATQEVTITGVHSHDAGESVTLTATVQTEGGATVARTVTKQGANWTLKFPATPGRHKATIQGVDRFGVIATAATEWITAYRYTGATAPTVPGSETTLVGVPTTASVTSWTRLEPKCGGADLGTTGRARILDPLWMMTRQWQVGEFQAEDAGSPIQTRIRATNALLTRCHLGQLGTSGAAIAYDPRTAPLDALVERRRMRRPTSAPPRLLPLEVDAGLNFLRMIDMNTAAKKYRAAFLNRYLLEPLSAEQRAAADPETLRFVDTMAGRAPDARRLAAALRPVGGAPVTFDPALAITAADIAAVRQVAAAWLVSYDSLASEPQPAAPDAWIPSRLEYGVSVATKMSAAVGDQLTLSASEYGGGRLEWSSFDVNGQTQLDTAGEQRFSTITELTVPAPVTIRGAPAARFWELEDARIAYGLISAGPTDLAQMMMIEYASSYGNDWYVVPLTLPVGSVSRIESLVVTDTFGVRSLLRPIGHPNLDAPHFSMWQSSNLRVAGQPGAGPVRNAFFLPSTVGRSLDGPILEDVLFLRDEMANLAWGVERSIEGGVETAVRLSEGPAETPTDAPPGPDAAPRYDLWSQPPENWTPLMPVQVDAQGSVRLRRAAVVRDGVAEVRVARSDTMNADPQLTLYDEEVPREGARITTRRRLARWTDGSSWLWTAARNDVGRGEGSANLQFDILKGGDSET